MTRIIFSVPPDMDRALHDLAESEDRPLSAIVRKALEAYLVKNGDSREIFIDRYTPRQH